MPIPTTDFFDRVLRGPYEALCRTPQAAAHLTGAFRYDGVVLEEGDTFELFGVTMTSQEAAQLLMIFNGARVHEQDQYDYGDDEAPPGTYFTTVHPDLVHEGHKNRVGIYDEQGAGEALFLDDVLAADPADHPRIMTAAAASDQGYTREAQPVRVHGAEGEGDRAKPLRRLVGQEEVVDVNGSQRFGLVSIQLIERLFFLAQARL